MQLAPWAPPANTLERTPGTGTHTCFTSQPLLGHAQVYACLPAVPWSIPADQLASRADFTAWRIFSIDPPTARDLDDALSIQPLAGGGWRVGVHIADVASFVPPGSPLDEEAARRGTSVCVQLLAHA